MESDAGHSVEDDVALETLLLPLQTGQLRWPADHRVLFLGARASRALPASAAAWTCVQTFRPYSDSLQRLGLRSVFVAPDESFDLVLALPSRQRDEARALLAGALQHARVGGVVLASLPNTEGARSAERDLGCLAGQVQSLSKSKCRAFWATAGAATTDAGLLAQWASLDAPRPILDGRFISRPGLFAWDRIDAASALLASCLPRNLSGRGADLGSGFGYLACELLARCPAVVALDLYEAEARALELARVNLAAQGEHAHAAGLGFHWHDVTNGLPERYDFIVSNPPFHQGRADLPSLGQAFILAAGAALLPGGSLWMVANRHLPYEAVLVQQFASLRTVTEQDGFKVIHAIKAK